MQSTSLTETDKQTFRCKVKAETGTKKWKCLTSTTRDYINYRHKQVFPLESRDPINIFVSVPRQDLVFERRAQWSF